MTLYVDDMLVPARPAGFRGPGTPKWSHMFADTPAELAEAAQALGLQPSWIQYPGTHREHFDVTSSVRQRALRDLGATPLRYPRDLVGFLEARRAVCQCTRLADCRWGAVRLCEAGCGCRYGTTDPDRRDCGCGGACSTAGPTEWGCAPDLGGCGGDCPTCPTHEEITP